MISFPDTSFLWALYRTQEHSARADALMARRCGPLPVSSLLMLGFRQSLRLHVRLRSRDKTKGFTREEASRMLGDLQSDLRANVFEVTAVDWAAVHQTAEELSGRYTDSQGHRLEDILHVATALHLGADEFLTFDANQKVLAEAAGLRVQL